MPRTELTDAQRQAGAQLGQALRRSRDGRTTESVAVAAGVGVDMLRKLERGVVPTPGFFLVAALAQELGADLNLLAREALVGGAEPTKSRRA